MAAMRRKSQAENLEDQRRQLEKEKQEVERQRREQEEWHLRQELKSKEQELQSLRDRLGESSSQKLDEGVQSWKATTAVKPKTTREILTDLVEEYDTWLEKLRLKDQETRCKGGTPKDRHRQKMSEQERLKRKWDIERRSQARNYSKEIGRVRDIT